MKQITTVALLFILMLGVVSLSAALEGEEQPTPVFPELVDYFNNIDTQPEDTACLINMTTASNMALCLDVATVIETFTNPQASISDNPLSEEFIQIVNMRQMLETFLTERQS